MSCIYGESQLLVDKYIFEFNNRATRTISMNAIVVPDYGSKYYFLSYCVWTDGIYFAKASQEVKLLPTDEARL